MNDLLHMRTQQNVLIPERDVSLKERFKQRTSTSRVNKGHTGSLIVPSKVQTTVMPGKKPTGSIIHGKENKASKARLAMVKVGAQD